MHKSVKGNNRLLIVAYNLGGGGRGRGKRAIKCPLYPPLNDALCVHVLICMLTDGCTAVLKWQLVKKSCGKIS